jgi:hypothetical protein
VDTKTASKEDVILEELRSLKSSFAELRARLRRFLNIDKQKALGLPECSREVFDQVLAKLRANGFPTDTPLKEKNPRHFHLLIEGLPVEDRSKFLEMARAVHPKARFLPNL